MGDNPPPSGPNPFGGLPFLPDPDDLPPSDGPVHWSVAAPMARYVATGGHPEPPVEAAEQDRLAAILRVAELRLSEITGLAVPPGAGPVRARAVTPGIWAAEALVHHRVLLEALGSALSRSDAPEDHPDPERAATLGAAARGMVFGWMVGQLAAHSLGRYDLPLPHPTGPDVVLVPANIGALAEAWALPPDDLRLWVCLHELALHNVLTRAHVHRRLSSLLTDYVSAFEVEAGAFEAEFDAVDPTDATSLRSVFGEPEALLAAVQTPAQQRLLPHLDALTAVLAGWADHVVARAGGPLVGSPTALAEVLRRRRADAGWGDRYAARLLGLELRQATAERGAAFVAGVVERSGEEALARLWASETTLPTPAEVDAPGLWLARIDLPEPSGYAGPAAT